ADLIDRLCQEPRLSPADQEGFRRLCQLLDATLHFEYHAHFEDLKNAYAPFDSDSDTQSLTTLNEHDRRARLDLLFERFDWLLERANFQRLSRADLESALQAVSHHGLRLEVDLDYFDRLEMYCRGEMVRVEEHRRWTNLFRTRRCEISIYQRLVIIFRLRPGSRATRHLDTKDVFIKLFKDVPKADLEMLLPGTRVKMSLRDRIKIVMPTVSGLAVSVYKAFKGALLAAAAGIYGILAVLGVTCGYGIRSFYGYLQTKQKYQLNLTESLYYQNLDNNAGVLSRLLNEAEEQENREALLAYFFLWRDAAGRGLAAAELDAQIERFLGQCLGRPVDFEVDDALAKLLRLGLARQNDDKRYFAISVTEALETLDRAWDSYFLYNAAA
ncbi:MAG TPA: TMEM143 family protein, partial [Pirellulales bacterium]